MIGCRRPDKIKYETRKDARRSARESRLRFRGVRLSAYRCDCGFYHVGRLDVHTIAGYSLDRWNRRQEQP